MNATRSWATFALLTLLFGAGARAEGTPASAMPSEESAAPAQSAHDGAPVAPEPAQAARPSLAAVNRELTDPVSDAWSIALTQNYFRIRPGNDAQDRWNPHLHFQGAFPVGLTSGLDLITRLHIDLLNSQPHPVPGAPGEIDRTTGFGDISLLQLLVPRRAWVGSWLLGVGPTWILPSGTSKWTSTGKWMVGPAGILGYRRESWILAALVQDWRSFAGPGSISLHSMSVQPIAAYFFPSGWSVGYSGNIVANWTSVASDRYTVPLGLQVGKVVRFGSTYVKVSLGGQWMPVHPERFGLVWNAQLAIQVLRPKLVEGTLSDPSSLRFRWEK